MWSRRINDSGRVLFLLHLEKNSLNEVKRREKKGIFSFFFFSWRRIILSKRREEKKEIDERFLFSSFVDKFR